MRRMEKDIPCRAPPDTTREVEEYQVELSDATVLELVIVPDNTGGLVRASLKSLRLAT